MNYSNFALLKDLLSLMWPQRRRFFAGTLLRFTSDLVWLFPPWALAEIINLATEYQTGDDLTQVWTLLALVAIIGVYHYAVHDWAKYMIYPIAERMRVTIFEKGIKQMFMLDNDWHEKENSGNKIQRINKAGESSNDLVRLYVDLLLESTVNIIGMTLVLFTISRAVSLYMVVFFISFYFLNRLMINRPSRETYKTNIEWEEFDGVVFESVNNIATIKALGVWRSIMTWLESSSKRLNKQIKERVFWYRIRSGVLNLYQVVFFQILLIFVVYQVFQGVLEVGMIALVLLYFQKISSAASEFAEVSYRFELGRVSIMRYKEIMDAKPTAEVSGTKKFPDKWKKLEIKELSFSYEGNKVLKNVNLKIKRGEKVGIVGVSGTGKSTLFKLLLKLYDRYEGHILFDGKELKDIKRDSYVKHFAYVPQETELFNLSLKQNVTLSVSGRYDKKRFEQALKIAHVDDFVNKLPEGVDSLIGEKGVKLSGGERQRVGIARAIYTQPELLLLDEATSHLDADSESKIQSALHDFFKGVTAIVIAHRLSTLKEMDRIVVMARGKVLEQGTFEELIQLKGAFHKLWEKQKF
ncbi:MAG: ABC-type multidrug transport system fused ATPase/permease subunit [Oceanicoccus sp.]|jgi:ABC-type multidrug transport system fused ATPase/permease subunit